MIKTADRNQLSQFAPAILLHQSRQEHFKRYSMQRVFGLKIGHVYHPCFDFILKQKPPEFTPDGFSRKTKPSRLASPVHGNQSLGPGAFLGEQFQRNFILSQSLANDITRTLLRITMAIGILQVLRSDWHVRDDIVEKWATGQILTICHKYPLSVEFALFITHSMLPL
jgi:hypothetical protein